MDLTWLQSDKAKRISRDARAKARAGFKSEYPDGDFSKIEAEVTFDENKKKHAPRLKSCTKLVQIIGRAFLILMNNTGVLTLNWLSLSEASLPS